MKDKARKIALTSTAPCLCVAPGNTDKGTFHFVEVRSKRKLVNAQVGI